MDSEIDDLEKKRRNTKGDLQYVGIAPAALRLVQPLLALSEALSLTGNSSEGTGFRAQLQSTERLGSPFARYGGVSLGVGCSHCTLFLARFRPRQTFLYKTFFSELSKIEDVTVIFSIGVLIALFRCPTTRPFVSGKLGWVPSAHRFRSFLGPSTYSPVHYCVYWDIKVQLP